MLMEYFYDYAPAIIIGTTCLISGVIIGVFVARMARNPNDNANNNEDDIASIIQDAATLEDKVGFLETTLNKLFTEDLPNLTTYIMSLPDNISNPLLLKMVKITEYIRTRSQEYKETFHNNDEIGENYYEVGNDNLYSPHEIISPAYKIFSDFSEGIFGLILHTLFYVFCVFAVISIPKFCFMLYKDVNNKLNFFILLFIAVIITTFFFLFPIIMLILTISGSILSFILAIQIYLRKFNYLNPIIIGIFNFLSHINVMTFLLDLYSFVFFKVSFNTFKYIIDFYFIFTLAYVTFSKVFIFCFVNDLLQYFSTFNYFLLLFMMFLSLYIWLFRISLLYANVIIISYQTRRLYIDNILLIEGNNPINEIPQSSSSDAMTDYPRPKSVFKGFFNRHYQRNTYYYPPRPWYYYSGNLILGVCTLGIGCYGAYLGYHALQATRAQNTQMANQNKELANQNRELARQNDLEELSQGLMTKEEYHKKWKS
jgi:uncharacterized membrane-anchored protein YhcB (DUF1043 family)